MSFTLSADAAVSAEVMNIAGHRVRTVTSGEMMAAGTNSVIWDGRGQSGPMVPSGPYLIRLHVKDQGGWQMQTMRRVNVLR